MDTEIYLIGAGFGNADLLTLKAVKILSKSTVVFYDSLVDEEALKYCYEQAEKIFVGKRTGQHHKTQAEINLLLLKAARKGGVITRLKGGDPYVFGRGHEEVAFLQNFGFEVNVVPGISSSYGLASMHQYCLTSKEHNDSFWVVTGHTRSNEVSNDLNLAAQSNATVVVLMGMENLMTIMDVFKSHRDNATTAIIISKGGTSGEKIIEGQIATIYEQYQKAEIENPALLMVGDSLMAAKEQYFATINAQKL